MKNPRIIIIALCLGLFFVSCKDEETEVTPIIAELTPLITNVEASNHDTGASDISLGGNISVEFDAKTRSDARLDFYHIEIHDHPLSGAVEDEYKIIDDSFKDEPTFKGLINAHVHQHVVVPDTANLGSYHVVVVVVDEDGNSANTEDLETHVTIIE